MTYFRHPMRLAIAACLYLAFAAVLFGRSLEPALSQTGQEMPKQVYEEKCSACHNAYDPAAQAMTMTQWRSTVNRMLYRHGASDEISPAETQTILGYLATFAVPEQSPTNRPRLGARQVDNSDVWADAPVYSRDYIFGADAGLASNLRPVSRGIAWKVLTTDGGQQLALRAQQNVAGPDLLLMPKPGANGGLRLEAEFKQSQVAPAPPAPLSFGLAFASDTQDGAPKYDIVCYDPRHGSVNVVQTSGSKAQTLATASTVNSVQLTASHPSGWQTLRVDVLGNRVKAWLNYNKVLDTMLPAATTTATAGVWTGSRASVKDLTVDVYAPQQ